MSGSYVIEQKQLITIKGTRDGLTLFINDSCLFQDAYKELIEVIATSRPKKDEPIVSVTVQLGLRYLHEREKEQLRKVMGDENRLRIQSFESDLILKDEALRWKDESDVKIINQIVRSGQELEVTGDLLLIGDVNPSGKVMATGNVYILGNLHGIAHDISRAPDYESAGVYMECGIIDEEQDKIIIDRLQSLTYKRKDLSGFERRMGNG